MKRGTAPFCACIFGAAFVSTGAGPAAAQDFTTPSGLGVSIAEVMADDGTVRLRLLAPHLGQAGAAYDDISRDFVWICETQVIPALAENGLAPRNIVISIADRPVPFGETDPGAVQFFEGFTVSGDTCVWELY